MYKSTFYEKKKHGTMEFPAAYYFVDSSHPQYHMPFHWHTEWELIRVRSGELILHVEEEEIHAVAGDAVLIRGSMFHGGTAKKCVYECFVFDLYGLFQGIEAIQKNIRPISQLKILPEILYKEEQCPKVCELVGEIMDTNYSAMKEGEKGSCKELITISCLGHMFGTILQEGKYHAGKQETMNSSHRIGRIKNVLEYIESHYQSAITLGDLAEVAGMNPRYFCRAFKEITMQSPMDYVSFYRIEQAVRLLQATELSVMEIAMECGFNDCSYFIRIFKKQRNMTPGQYRKGISLAE